MPQTGPQSRLPAVETLPTVTLEHARTGQPLVVDLRDYLAGSGGRFADWRLQGTAGFAAPPALKSEGGPADPEPVDESPPPSPPPGRRRRHRRRGR